MGVQSIANTMFLLLGIVCVILSVRAFYVYNLSRSDPLFIIGLAMATIALAIFCGIASSLRIIGYSTLLTAYSVG